jgi:hypothetical protein
MLQQKLLLLYQYAQARCWQPASKIKTTEILEWKEIIIAVFLPIIIRYSMFLDKKIR